MAARCSVCWERVRARAQQLTGRSVKIVVIQEAGLDGFWVHRLLEANDIESHVVDPASIAVPRRRRRAKTATSTVTLAILAGSRPAESPRLLQVNKSTRSSTASPVRQRPPRSFSPSPTPIRRGKAIGAGALIDPRPT
jgi:transposase